MTEFSEMIVVAEWLNARGALWFHPHNEGRRSIGMAVKMKRAGILNAGLPDIMILERWRTIGERNAMHYGFGIAIELKAKAGVLSDAQRGWLDALRERGWLAEACWGADAALKILQESMRK